MARWQRNRLPGAYGGAFLFGNRQGKLGTVDRNVFPFRGWSVPPQS